MKWGWSGVRTFTNFNRRGWVGIEERCTYFLIKKNGGGADFYEINSFSESWNRAQNRAYIRPMSVHVIRCIIVNAAKVNQSFNQRIL